MQKSRSSYFSMYQFRNLFNTCRIPLKNKDRLVSNFKTGNSKDLNLFVNHLILIT